MRKSNCNTESIFFVVYNCFPSTIHNTGAAAGRTSSIFVQNPNSCDVAVEEEAAKDTHSQTSTKHRDRKVKDNQHDHSYMLFLVFHDATAADALSRIDRIPFMIHPSHYQQQQQQKSRFRQVFQQSGGDFVPSLTHKSSLLLNPPCVQRCYQFPLR